MYNPYQNQNQGNAFPQGNNYYQQGQQPMQQQQHQPQQPQQGYMGVQTQGTGYNPSLQPNTMVSQSFGTTTGNNVSQPQQQTGMNNLGVTSNIMQPQSSNSYYQTGNQPNTGMNGMNNFQSQPMAANTLQSTLQPQGTGYYNNNTGNATTVASTATGGMQSLQNQSTGYYSNPTQNIQPTMNSQVLPMQPLQTQASAPLQPLQPQLTSSLQPLQPQQTGFYAQQYQVPLEPLKPTATGFVNSFANNGLNNDIKIPAIRLSFITAKDQAKFETLFRASVKPGSNTITGKGCRSILMKSGLQPSQLAKIWTLCDTSKAGELLFPEFALAMHLVNDVLQGDQIPYELDSKTKNEVNSFIDAINLSIATNSSATSGATTPFDELMAAGPMQMQATGGMIPQTSFGMPAQVTGGLMPQSTGYIPQTSFGMPAQMTGGLMAQVTGGMQNNSMMPQNTFNQPLQTQITGGGMAPGMIQPQITGGFTQPQPQPQPQQIAPQQTGPMTMPTLTFGQGGLTNQMTGMQPPPPQAQQQPMPSMGLQPQATGYLPPSNFNPTVPLVAQKTGFGNNEIYAQSNFARNLTNQMNQQQEDNDTISNEEKSLFYKIFETYDNNNTGLIDSPTAVEIFRKSGLNRSDLEHIWNLCDTNNSGQLNKQEFALGMHLVYRKLNNQQIPNRLPASLIPSSNRILDNLKTQLKSSNNSELNNSGSKINGLGYKNNDNENGLPTFRNRRKNFSTTTTASTTSESTDGNESPSVTEASQKYPDISNGGDLTPSVSSQPVVEKKEPVETIDTTNTVVSSTSSLSEDIQRITEIRYELESLQLPSITGNTKVSYDLQKRFDTIINTVPQLFSEIASINTKITDAKIELANLRSGVAIEGTGPNGEVTENDKKKAKSRALLKARMAALTGKPGDSSNDDDKSKQNAEELNKIKQESAKNQEIIKDIRSSISDISSSLKSTFTGKNIYDDSEAFEMYEFGSGLEKEVRDFIKELNKDPLLAQKNVSSSSATTSSGSNNSSSDSHGSNDRSSYLKEQAQKRMKERLAKFGINKRGERSRSNTTESVKTPFEVEEDYHVPAQHAQSTQQQQQQQVVAQATNNTIANQNEDEGEDEEERQLRERLENLKLKKKADKERRLAELRKQIEEAEADSDDNDDDTPVMTKTINLNNIPSQSVAPQVSSSINQKPINTPAVAPTPPAMDQTKKPNPFFKQDTNSTASSFDQKAAELQRNSQRGFANDDDDDGWSDDEPEQKVAMPVNIAPAVPVASPIPQPQESVAPVPIATPPVPLAPPIPQVQESEAPVPVATIPLPLAPPIPEGQDQGPPVPMAPPIPQIQEQGPPVPMAPPIPQVQEPMPNIPIAPTNNADFDNDDVLSIPESVDSGDEGSSMAISSIPPPPPLP